MDRRNTGTGERRKGPDSLVKWVRISSILSWVTMAVIVVITMAAMPGFESFFDTSFHIRLEYSWNSSLLRYALGLLIFLFVFCMLSLLINVMRCRRKSDKFNRTLILNTVLSLAGIVTYFIFYLNRR